MLTKKYAHQSHCGRHASRTPILNLPIANQRSLFSQSQPTHSPKGKMTAINTMVKERLQDLVLSTEQVLEIKSKLNHEIERGLGKDTHASSSVKCFITYVQDLPNSKERGKFLALDLGGTNFRVLLITLAEGSHFHMDSKIYAVPKDIMLGPGTGLFDHIAECLADFMKEYDVYKEKLPLGFTFSFPCVQEGLTKARLSTWTKGFKCEGVEGNDVVQLLKDAIARRGDVQIDVMAVLNDTTGTLMSCAYKKHNCRVGLIVGTGSNACYFEKLENVQLWDGPTEGVPDQVIINTEWGAFGDNGVLENIFTEYDRTIDKESINPGKQLFEKMISGMYMGELVRLVLVKLTQEGLLFGGKCSDVLLEKGSFYTKYVSEIESDKQGEYHSCTQVLEELGLAGVASDTDLANVRIVCELVSRRAAHLTSAGVACLLDRMGEKDVTVAVDGSVYRFHPHFHHLMMDKIAELIDPSIKFDLMLSEDGSGRGAALVAAVACRDR
ncbi:hexokinase type 2 isoform X2 [Neocloeon triangulifer]|uniref:hexokinase type 2 isoform X2 n=1 Tax=Neocloeon triangulifer TaxID=2078957 RepID=UPI00286F81F6|nr:hexokinase type 2 isoform X2 [Neocloeon triangulifer]